MDEETPVPFKQYFPKLSMSSYFWVVIGIAAVFFGIIGYFVGIRVNDLQSSSTSLGYSTVSSPTPTIPAGGDNDANLAQVYGTFTTSTNYYDQLAVNVDSIQNGVKTNLDSDFRDITKPQTGIKYPYLFSRLDPSKTYIVSASACRANPKTYALECAKNIKITGCTGTIQGDSCIITWQGNIQQRYGAVDFSITKADNSTSNK